MIRLEKSEFLQRKIRQDDITELAIPTFTLTKEAIQAGRIDEALKFLDYAEQEDIMIHDSLVIAVDSLSRYIADKFGEEELPKALRVRYYDRAKERLRTPGVMGLVQRGAEFQRSHHGSFTVTEEPDRYVVSADPCGSGGRLRRTVKDIGVTKKAYPWSWGRIGISYYCCHCCLGNEIFPIEIRGYQQRICIPGERPEDPCIQYYYKSPELIPEEYFTRVGKTKTLK